MKFVLDLSVVGIDDKAEEVVAVFVLQLHGLFVEVKGGELGNVWVVGDGVCIDDDCSVVNIAPYPNLMMNFGMK